MSSSGCVAMCSNVELASAEAMPTRLCAIERGDLPGEADNRLVKLFELIFLSAVTQTCPIAPLVVPGVVGADTMCTPTVQAHSTPGCECVPPVQRLRHTSARFQELTTS